MLFIVPVTTTFDLNNTHVLQQHGVVAAITGLIYFIRKMNKIKYRTNRERDDDNKYDNGANKRPASTLVVNGIDGAAVTVHAGGNRQSDVVGDPYSGTVDDEMRRNDGVVVKNRNYSGFKDRREKNSPSVVVVDIENDEQENVNAPN